MKNPLTNTKWLIIIWLTYIRKGENKCKMLYLYQKNYNL